MKFEFDENKSRENLEKHGLDFVEAQDLWARPVLALPARDMGETRELAIGRYKDSFWTAVVTFRGKDRIRLISVRRSRKEEIDAYHKTIGGKKDENKPEEPAGEI